MGYEQRQSMNSGRKGFAHPVNIYLSGPMCQVQMLKKQKKNITQPCQERALDLTATDWCHGLPMPRRLGHCVGLCGLRTEGRVEWGRQKEGKTREKESPVKHPHTKTMCKTQDGTESMDFTTVIRKMDKRSLQHYLKDDYLKALPKQI